MANRPLPDLPGTYQATMFATAEGHPTNNIFTFRVTPAPATGSPDLAVAASVATAVNARWATFATAVYPQVYIGSHVRVYALHSPIAPAVVVPNTIIGGNLGAIAALMVGAAINHTVFRRGKGSQSRTTITPILQSELDTTGTEISTAFQTSLTAVWNAYITGVLTDLNAAYPGTWQYVQLSKGTPAKGPIVVPPNTYPITASNAELKLTTQRRRVQRNS